MCGICGFIGVGEPEDLAAMTEALAHRGPDSGAEWTDPSRGVFLGHRRLAVVDLGWGQQPMSTSDGDLIVVFNGEIYNHVELRRQLESLGHRFISDHSDTEVLLYGYRQWGPDLPNRLNGMWAFAIYDVQRQMLFASRDRFGKKPFYYATVHGGFAFASEAESLRRHPAVAKRIRVSRQSVRKYFAYGYIPAPLSIWDGIYKLPAGHSLVVWQAKPTYVQIERYWRFVLEPEPITSGRQALQKQEELRTALDRAVLRRLVADVPVGVFLSGGIDSSAVAAFAAKTLQGGRVSTFSIAFDEPSFDESSYARLVAKHCQTTHYERRLSIEAGRGVLPSLVRKLDEPIADSSLVPTSLLCAFAREYVTVALGGDGGDELFAGYDPFKAIRTAQALDKWLPVRLHQGISMMLARLPVSHRNMSFDFKIKRFMRGVRCPPALRVATWMAPLTPTELDELFHERAEPEEVYSEAIEAWDSCKQGSEIDRTLQFYTELYLQNDILAKVDRASMHVGLEARAPFLDIEVVNLARTIPTEWKFRRGETKFILKRALEPLLPKQILYRPKKGFGMPIGSWFKEGVLDIPSPHLNAQFTGHRLAAHRAGAHDDRAFLWAMWLLTDWYNARRR